MNVFFFLIVLSTFSMTAHASPKKVAVVKLIRGTASALSLGKTTVLKTEDWVEDGSVIKTLDKSFVKLVFLDKSQMNVGPNSEMKIEKFSGKDSGVIDLVKGKIRSQVTKDYLQIKDKDKSKLFIKTNNAVMGVRGTDFMISTNGTNTATVLFEGEVVFNNLPNPNTVNTRSLEQTVSAGVRIVPGEFSVVDAGGAPTVPSVLNVQQFEKLERNQNFSETSRSPASASTEAKSVVPPGLSGVAVSNSSATLKSELAQVAAAPALQAASPSGSADGFASADSVKPTNGSFVHIESGVIIPPPAGSVLDPNTNTYIASSAAGSVSADGSYVPPKDVVITDAGQILVTVVNASGEAVQKEVPKPAPVTPSSVVVNTSVESTGGRAPASVGTASSFTAPPAANPGSPVAGPGSIFNPTIGNPNVPLPTGGVNPTSDPAVISQPSRSSGDFTIRVQRQ